MATVYLAEDLTPYRTSCTPTAPLPGAEPPNRQVIIKQRVHKGRSTVANLDGGIRHGDFDRVHVPGPRSVMVSPPLPFDDLSLEGDQRDFVRAIHPVQMTTMVGGEVWRGL